MNFQLGNSCTSLLDAVCYVWRSEEAEDGCLAQQMYQCAPMSPEEFLVLDNGFLVEHWRLQRVVISVFASSAGGCSVYSDAKCSISSRWTKIYPPPTLRRKMR